MSTHDPIDPPATTIDGSQPEAQPAVGDLKTANPMNLGLGEKNQACPHPPSGQPLGSYPILHELRELLGGETALIPIPRGTKAPAHKGWQKATTADMLDPDYRARLATGNIGVLLGEPSGGLSTVDIDSDEEFARFLQLNPILGETLITKGARGGQLWFKIKGSYPPLTKLKRRRKCFSVKVASDFSEGGSLSGFGFLF
jgi:hypothetical protein